MRKKHTTEETESISITDLKYKNNMECAPLPMPTEQDFKNQSKILQMFLTRHIELFLYNKEVKIKEAKEKCDYVAIKRWEKKKHPNRMPLSCALEIMSMMYGFKSWQTLSPILKKLDGGKVTPPGAAHCYVVDEMWRNMMGDIDSPIKMPGHTRDTAPKNDVLA